MSNASFYDLARDRFRSGLAEIAGKWGWYFALGAFLVILGVIASGMGVVTTMFSVVVLGWILLGSGAGLVILSFLMGRWRGFMLSLACCFLNIVTGIETLSYVVSKPVAITLLIGII